MKNFLPVVLGLVLCLLLSACVATSENPLSSPETAQPDPKLIGTWHEKGDNNESYEFTLKDAHWMHVEDRKNDKPVESYDMFVTVIDGNRFLNVRHVGLDEQGHPFKKEYFVMRYEVTNHVFSTWMLDQDKAAAAVRSGKLKGTVQENQSKVGNPPHSDVDVFLQDSGANMVKFIHENGPKALFSDKPCVMLRVENAKP
jgi:hypothetical protein